MNHLRAVPSILTAAGFAVTAAAASAVAVKPGEAPRYPVLEVTLKIQLDRDNHPKRCQVVEAKLLPEDHEWPPLDKAKVRGHCEDFMARNRLRTFPAQPGTRFYLATVRTAAAN